MGCDALRCCNGLLHRLPLSQISHDLVPSVYAVVLKCGSCGAMVTAEERTKRQKNGNVHSYIYYHCTKQTKPRCAEPLVEEKALELEFDKAIADLEISAAFRDWAFAKLRRENETESSSRGAVLAAQQKVYNDVIKKIDGLVEMRASKEIGPEEFKIKKAELEKDKERLFGALQSTDVRISDWLDRAEKTFDFATNARENFAVASPDKRREFVAALAEDSNLLLTAKKIAFSEDNRFFILKKRLENEPSVKPGFEPPRTSKGRAPLSTLYEKNPVLRKGRDSNSRHHFWYTIFPGSPVKPLLHPSILL